MLQGPQRYWGRTPGQGADKCRYKASELGYRVTFCCRHDEYHTTTSGNGQSNLPYRVCHRAVVIGMRVAEAEAPSEGGAHRAAALGAPKGSDVPQVPHRSDESLHRDSRDVLVKGTRRSPTLPACHRLTRAPPTCLYAERKIRNHP